MDLIGTVMVWVAIIGGVWFLFMLYSKLWNEIKGNRETTNTSITTAKTFYTWCNVCNKITIQNRDGCMLHDQNK